MLEGSKIAQKIKEELKAKIKKEKIKPGLAVILIGKDPGSVVYVRLKEKAAQEIGINFKKFSLPKNISQKKVLALIEKLNKDKKIHGIIVQVPTPKHLHTPTLLKTISAKKDVDSFKEQSRFISPVHQGIIKLIKASKKNLHNKKALILAKNPFFIKGLEALLKKMGLRTKTVYLKKNLPKKEIKKSEILITILGKPHIIKPEMVRKNAILIDVGYSRLKGKPCGDIDTSVREKTPYLSPVPGGIGPLTVIYLLKNVYLSAKKFNKS